MKDRYRDRAKKVLGTAAVVALLAAASCPREPRRPTSVKPRKQKPLPPLPALTLQPADRVFPPKASVSPSGTTRRTIEELLRQYRRVDVALSWPWADVPTRSSTRRGLKALTP